MNPKLIKFISLAVTVLVVAAVALNLSLRKRIAPTGPIGTFEGVIIEAHPNTKTLVMMNAHPIFSDFRRETVIGTEKEAWMWFFPLLKTTRSAEILDERGNGVDFDYFKEGFSIKITGNYEEKYYGKPTPGALPNTVVVDASEIKILNTTRFSKYFNPRLGISFLYPSCWEKEIIRPENFLASAVNSGGFIADRYGDSDYDCENPEDNGGFFEVLTAMGEDETGRYYGALNWAESLAVNLTPHTKEPTVTTKNLRGYYNEAVLILYEPTETNLGIIVKEFPEPVPEVCSKIQKLLVIKSDVPHILGIGESLVFPIPGTLGYYDPEKLKWQLQTEELLCELLAAQEHKN